MMVVVGDSVAGAFTAKVTLLLLLLIHVSPTEESCKFHSTCPSSVNSLHESLYPVGWSTGGLCHDGVDDDNAPSSRRVA